MPDIPIRQVCKNAGYNKHECATIEVRVTISLRKPLTKMYQMLPWCGAGYISGFHKREPQEDSGSAPPVCLQARGYRLCIATPNGGSVRVLCRVAEEMAFLYF